MSDIYTLMRSIIGDSVSPYTIADIRILKYLDIALDKLSEIKIKTVEEDITIDSSDISAGYKEVGHEICSIIDIPLGTEHVSWEVDSKKKIRFIDSDDIPTGTYTIMYTSRYKKFDGALRDNSYFDYPRELDLAIVFYALAVYQQENGVIDANGARRYVNSKSEEGMSISYGSLGSVTETIGSPSQLKLEAINMMRNVPGSSNLFFTV